MSEQDIVKRQTGEAIALTALRVTVGVIFAVHGAMKLLDIPGTIQGFTQLGIPYPQYAVYLAIAGELLGGLGMVFGLLTRVAALGALCSMAVAIAYAHLGHGLLASKGGWEYPLVLGMVALYLVTTGAGPFSMDALYRHRRNSSPHSRNHRVRSYA